MSRTIGRLRRFTAVAVAAVMVLSGTNVFAVSSGNARSASAGVGDGAETEKIFGVSSVFPDDRSSFVPVNTGIEITFNDRYYADIDGLFSITPEVSGKFERHGKTVAFIPDSELEYASVYTVTLGAGVKNTVTGEATSEDVSFSFETRSKEDAKDIDDQKNLSWSIYLNNEYAELPSDEAPRVSLSYYYDAEKERPDPQVEVYSFADSTEAVEYIASNGSDLWWTEWNSQRKNADVSEMEKVGSFKLNERYDSKNHFMEMPFKLSEGFYIVNITCEGVVKQMVLQISDLPVQVISDGSKTVFWVNDAMSGKAAAGAEISVFGGQALGVTGGDGTFCIDSSSVKKDLVGYDGEAFYQVTLDGCSNVLVPEYVRGRWYYSEDSYWNGLHGKYWNEFQLDRSIFQEDDYVGYWGYAAPRAQTVGKEAVEEIKTVTVAVSEGWSSQDVLYKETAAVTDGAFSGKLKLPSLEAGYYCLSVYKGSGVVSAEQRISSEYFSVEKYVKPTYKIELEADKNAIFADESVNFTARAAFYEGTAAPGLDISYNASRAFKSRSGNAVTNGDGMVKFAESIDQWALDQGENRATFGVYAKLPEKGNISTAKEITVFNNDINVDISSERSGKRASLAFEVNEITLDKINSAESGGVWESGDELGAAVEGKTLDIRINRVWWEKVKTGTSYNYITKKTQATYRYDRHEEVIDEFSVTTGRDGKAERLFKVPDRELESYYASVSCSDNSGKSMSFTSYLGDCYDDVFYGMYEGNTYHLDGVQESYKEGDSVKLRLKYGDDNINVGNCMFVELHNGIKSYKAGSFSYSGKFAAEDAPNKYIKAYYFNGKKYVSGYMLTAELLYDCEERGLDINVKTDKESYKPGDECTVTVSVKALDGKKAKKAHINLAVVDEALFDVEEYTVDTLGALYRSTDSGLTLETATHSAYIMGGADDAADGGTSNGTMEDSAASGGSSSFGAFDLNMKEESSAESTSVSESVREDFRDTAAFAAFDTDANGKASYKFVMPDDITSWRFTVSAVTDDFYAGNSVINVNVSAPVILNYTLADTFMSGDIPSVGVSAYGESIKNGASVKYEVWDESAPAKKYTASGSAFERVNIPLWQMKETGHHSMMIKATAANGKSDTVKHEYDVVETNRTAETVCMLEAEAGMSFKTDDENGAAGAASGITRIILADEGRGKYLPELMELTYGSHMRLETALAGSRTAALLEEYFPDYAEYIIDTGCEIQNYQKDDGGFAALPYAASDIKTTVQAAPLLAEDSAADLDALEDYFAEMSEKGSAEERAMAIYGLAVLGASDPAQTARAIKSTETAGALESSAMQNVYIALACVLSGDTKTASDIYDARLKPLMENNDPYCRMKAGTTADDVLEATGACMYLAALLEKSEAENMYNYCVRNDSSEIVKNIYEILYISEAMARAPQENGSVTYKLYGETVTRKFGSENTGASFMISVPGSQLDKLSIKSVKGSVCAALVKKTKVETSAASLDNYVKIKRKYYVKGSSEASSVFKQGDIIKVNVWVDYSADALMGGYAVADYLPAGLAYVDDEAVTGERSYSQNAVWADRCDGQKVIFTDYGAKPGKGRLYTYYARVISPGIYSAEGAIVQSSEAASVVYTGTADKITIK